MSISEETLNRFLSGMTVDRICAYSGDVHVASGDDITGLQVWFQNGSFLGVYPRDDRLAVSLHGPDMPDHDVLRECWAEDLDYPGE